MKRWLLCILAVCILLTMTACRGKVDGDDVTLPPLSGDLDGHLTQVDVSAVELTLVDTEYEAGSPRSITVEWHNLSKKEVYYYAAFDVFRYENGEKIDCAAEPLSFIEIAYVLSAGDRQQQTYSLDGFDLTTPNDDGKLTFEFAADYTLQGDTPQTLTATLTFDVSDPSPQVSLTVDEVVKEGNNHHAQVTWHNDSDFEVTYGRPYTVEYLENGEWVDTSLADLCFTMEAIILRPHSQNTERYAFVSNGYTLFDVSRAGTYRIATDATVNSQNITLYAEFTI